MAPSRNLGIDAFRVVAASAIVVSHTLGIFPADWLPPRVLGMAARLLWFGVPFFFFAAGWAYVGSYERHGGVALTRRIRRLAVIFVVWWAVNVALLQPPSFLGDMTPQQVLFAIGYGWPVGAYWFFPAAIVLAITGHAVIRRGPVCARHAGVAWALWAACVVLTAVLPGVLAGRGVGPFTIGPEYWFLRSPLMWAGAYFTGMACAAGELRPTRGAAASLAGAAAVLSAVFVVFWVLSDAARAVTMGNTLLIVAYTSLGTAAGFAGLTMREGRAARLLARIAPYSLGVYVAHPLLMTVIKRGAARLGLNWAQEPLSYSVLVLAASWLAAVAFTLAWARVRGAALSGRGARAT